MSQELLLKRLQYRSHHRGCKETDLVFGKFSQSVLATLDPASLCAYEKLLEESDADIWNWLTDKEETPQEYINLMDILKKSEMS